MILISAIIVLFLCIVSMYIKNRSLRLDNIILEKRVEEIRNNYEIYRKNYACNQNRNEIDIQCLKNLNSSLLMENMQLKQMVSAYKNAFGNGFQNAYTSPKIPPATIEAVKYAMKKAHPDNGGSTEDFMKFKECYEELTKK